MPRPPKEIAIGRLQRQLDEIPGLKLLKRDSSEFTKWERDTKVAIANTFIEPSNHANHINEFDDISYVPAVSIANGTLAAQYQNAYISGLNSAAAILTSMINEIQEYWPDNPQQTSIAEASESQQLVNTNRVFVIHGRDHGTRDTVKSFLQKLELDPVILEEQPDQGLTTIEKFEQNASGGFVVALLTPDDVGGPSASELKPRARQNVVFELGYFVRAFGRNRVRALIKGNVEIPSDYAGVLYLPMDESGGWQMRLIREMNSAGFNIDANRAL